MFSYFSKLEQRLQFCILDYNFILPTIFFLVKSQHETKSEKLCLWPGNSNSIFTAEIKPIILIAL